jgi:hypothetical protein
MSQHEANLWQRGAFAQHPRREAMPLEEVGTVPATKAVGSGIAHATRWCSRRAGVKIGCVGLFQPAGHEATCDVRRVATSGRL